MNKILKLRALTSFIKLGFVETREARRILRLWIRYQRTIQSTITLKHQKKYHFRLRTDKTIDANCRFFLTAHFGYYPAIIKYLSEVFPTKKIVCIIAKQDHLSTLNLLAESQSLNIEFIEVGQSLISLRKIIYYRDNGDIFLAFIDVPIGVSSSKDTWLPFMNGKIRAKSGLLQISEKLNLEARLIISGEEERGNVIPLSLYEATSLETLFRKFATHVEKQPFLWDKISDLHFFYMSELGKGIYVPFKIEGEHFILEASKNKAHKISRSLYAYICRLEQETHSDQATLARKKQQINEKTYLNWTRTL